MLRHLWQIGFLIVYTVLMLGLLGIGAAGVYIGAGVLVGVVYLAVWGWLHTLNMQQREAAGIVLLYVMIVLLFTVGISIGVYANSNNILVALGVGVVLTSVLMLFFYVRLWGTVLAIRGDLEGAINHFSLVLGTRLRNPNTYLARGQLRQRTGDLDGALRDFDTVLRARPQHLTALVSRAEIHTERRDYDAALAVYDTALDAQPGLASAFLGKINVYIRSEDYDRAIRECNQALSQQLLPFVEAALFISRGVAHCLQGEHQMALDDFDAATEVEIRPQDQASVAYLVASNRGMVYFCQKAYQRAWEHMQQAYDLMPTEERVQAGMAVCAYALGQHEDAYAYWRGLMDKDRRYWHIAWVRQRLNWPDPMVDTAEIIIIQSDSLHA